MLRSSSTRHLAVGTYLDADFRDAVLDEVLARRDRAVAPTFTTDAVPVVRHALNARRHQLARDAALTGILLLFLVVEGRTVLGVLALTGAVMLGWRALKAMLRLKAFAALALVVPAVLLVLIAALLFESNSGWYSSINGSTGYEAPVSLTGALGRVLGVLAVLLGAAWTAVVVERLVNRQTILDHLTAPVFDPDDSPAEPRRHSARIAYVAQAQTGNVTYYAAEHPFVGSGTVVNSWTGSVPLVLAGPGGLPLTTEALRDALSLAVSQLSGADAQLGDAEEVSVQERILAPSTLALVDPSTGLLRHRLSPEEMDDVATGANRYLAVRSTAGETEIWVFVRCEVQGRSLHLELFSSSIAPVRAAYREPELGRGPGVVLRTALGALPDLPDLLLRAPLRLLLTAAGPGSGGLRQQLRQLGTTSSAGRGARASVRELGAEDASGDFLAGLAVERHARRIEQQVLETVATTLEQSGYDTEELRHRTQVVLDGPTR
ncbi:hypothetical protein [Kineosporia succinea]|uniref:Uncharacterized protein n=1 Tax=Kineosporia succinea TaxID=84632 RepID=A0ABT9P5A4_9ACTN|nr:hypothetical protein [Kineosporia succinea]MDP9827875.1 hypothetical protein [Kineosporia succinea]